MFMSNFLRTKNYLNRLIFHRVILQIKKVDDLGGHRVETIGLTIGEGATVISISKLSRFTTTTFRLDINGLESLQRCVH